jgi:hypothetical protein
MGSLETLHFTTPGVEKKNDQVMMKLPTPIKDPSADRAGIKDPRANNTAIVNSVIPSKSASPLTPKTDSQETNGLLDI